MDDKVMNDVFCQMNGRIAVISGSLGHMCKGEYLIEPDCLEAVKDLIRLLKKDDKCHISRRCLGKTNIVKYHLIHIIKSCLPEMADLFSITLRLLINLSTPAFLLYGEEIPQDKVERHIYIALLDYNHKYKAAFSDIEFWHKICTKLTSLFEIDWTERSADQEIEIERILTLLRNVLYIPSDVEEEKKPDNDSNNHDKVIEALHHSHFLELLLFISSQANEESYYLNLLEIFYFLLREQNPKVLAYSNAENSSEEKIKDITDIIKSKKGQNSIGRNSSNIRSFNSCFVIKGVKSVSNIDVVCHKSLEKLKSLNICQNQVKKSVKNKIATEIGNIERRSTVFIRILLKEFCTEFLNKSFSNFMNVVKNKLDSGKSLAHDQTYYFWALSFFLKFVVESKANIDLIKNSLTIESFHFIQTNIDAAFEYLITDKKKVINWVKRIHIILKAYNSLLETLLFMDNSRNPLNRALSREIKSEIFYVVEYREMTLHLLLKYDFNKFPLSYLQDLVQTTHLFIKLLEEFSKQKKLIVQKVIKCRKLKYKEKSKTKEGSESQKTKKDKWEEIKDKIYDMIVSETSFPEISPFDSTLDIPIDEQKKKAIKSIQKCLLQGQIEQSIGLLRSSREVWPENNCFGFDGMSVEDETVVLQEICLAELGPLNENIQNSVARNEQDELNLKNEKEEIISQFVEQDFNILNYKKRFVHKKVVECCGILLKYYKKNSDHINHCALKLLHRISWECCMPSMLYQASLLWALLCIMNDPYRQYNEINIFTVNLLRRLRKDATKNKVVFLELLFWKDYNIALEIQHGYSCYSSDKSETILKKKKLKNKAKANDLSDDFKIIQKTEKKIMENESKIENEEKVNKQINEKILKYKTKNKKCNKICNPDANYITKFKERTNNEESEELFFINEVRKNLLFSKKKKKHDFKEYLESVDDKECHNLNYCFKKRIKSLVLPDSSEDEESNENNVFISANSKNLTEMAKKALADYDSKTSEKYEFQNFSKAKRQRFIDSDSDEEELLASRSNRKKKLVVDSESDIDVCEVDGKN